jgi:glucosamine--fructose-6-phosphate aminotransferase (isomerizing)
MLGNVEEVRAREGQVIALVDEDDDQFSRLSGHLIRMPPACALLAPVIATVPLQLLAYHIADLRGTDVDQPRNLAKSVTVE